MYFLTGGSCASEARAAVRAAMRAFPGDDDLMEEASDALGIGVQYTGGIARVKNVDSSVELLMVNMLPAASRGRR